MTDRPETLIHYTHPWHMPNILKDKTIWPTESNVSIQTTRAGPDVVWAVDTLWVPEEAELPHGLLADKLNARITFKTPKRAVRWYDWPWINKMEDFWKVALVNAGGGDEAAKHWWVVDHPIVMKHWTAFELRDDDGVWHDGEYQKIDEKRKEWYGGLDVSRTPELY